MCEASVTNQINEGRLNGSKERENVVMVGSSWWDPGKKWEIDI